MPVSLTYPGVYVQEVPSGVHTITGVSTSTTLFIGSCADGPINMPTLCLSYTDFARQFSEDTTVSDMARYVKLFYLNGGTTCYVMRIANGAAAATVTLLTEAGGNSLLLTAANEGFAGNAVRAAVTYDTDQPEATFNLELFRWGKDSGGNPVKLASELWRNLTMNVNSPLYAEAFLNQNSALVNATDVSGKAAGTGFSQSGRSVVYDGMFSASELSTLITPTSCKFQLVVGSLPPVEIDLTGAAKAASLAGTFASDVDQIILTALSGFASPPTVTTSFLTAPPVVLAGSDKQSWLQFKSTGQDVFIVPAMANDIAVALMLGTAQGGYEVGAWAGERPAATGTSIPPSHIFGTGVNDFAAMTPSAISALSIGAAVVPWPASGLQTKGNTDAMCIDAAGNRDGLREKLRLIQQQVTAFAASSPTFGWSADLWGYRLVFRNSGGADNGVGTLAFTTWASGDTENVRYYPVGTMTAGPFNLAGLAGSVGNPPLPIDYSNSYPTVDREVDIFNLMVLPSAKGVDQTQLWGPASIFCQQRRAFLIMDPPASWTDAQTAQTLVDNLRIGLVKDYSAVYFPKLTITENSLPVTLGPSGALAGIYARIDASRGVWKAPAGVEASLLGVSGLEKRFSDLENGVLNPKAINTLRIFPDGAVSWGARTNAGSDSNPNDWKYIPIRRLALYMEESLYRGLKWVVFEPNDEPLWGQIRLNVGAFMHGLYTQGAFQGQTPKDAYFVRCDKETTTQDDANKGIVNIWVGFAPLKPAEFVVLYLQQMAGQIQV